MRGNEETTLSKARQAQCTPGACYFRGGMFTCVPRNVRADLDEMAEWGSDVVCLAVNVPDLNYNATSIGFLVDYDYGFHEDDPERNRTITRKHVIRFKGM